MRASLLVSVHCTSNHPSTLAPRTAKQGPLGHSDLTKWRLDSTDGGRHVWHYVRDEEGRAGSVIAPHEEVWGLDDKNVRGRDQTEEDKFWLGIDIGDGPGTAEEPASTPLEAARRGFEFYQRIQSEDGHWAGEYGGACNLLACE